MYFIHSGMGPFISFRYNFNFQINLKIKTYISNPFEKVYIHRGIYCNLNSTNEQNIFFFYFKMGYYPHFMIFWDVHMRKIFQSSCIL